jgi:hypothetical protein
MILFKNANVAADSINENRGVWGVPDELLK